MSSLNENLQEIYNIKLQIKDAIGTNSDVFADYPDMISSMGGGSGTCAFKFYAAENSYEFFTDNTEDEGFPCFTYELGTVTLPQDSMLNWHIRADIDTDYFRYADKYCTGYIEVEPNSGDPGDPGSAQGILVFNDTQGDTIDIYDPNGSEIVMENCKIEMRLDEGEDQWLMFLTWDYGAGE